MNARNMVLEDYPDAVIEVMDTQVDTVLQGIFTLEVRECVTQAGAFQIRLRDLTR